MKNSAWLALLIIPLLLLGACTAPADTPVVTMVIDGDTIVIDTGQRVRYIGMDTPEVHSRVEALGIKAWQANRDLVEGKRVRLEKDVSETDRYGRLLRYVYVDDIFVNAELVRRGLAEARAYPPDTRHQELLEAMEREARAAERGIWAQ